jgi:hypothetical protein
VSENTSTKAKMIETTDVEVESSPTKERADISIDSAPETEVEQIQEDVQKVEPEVEQPKPQKVPLTRLKREIAKRKELEEQVRSLSANNTNVNNTVAQTTTNPQTATTLKRPTLAESEYDEAAHEAAMEKYELAQRESLFKEFEQRQAETTQAAETKIRTDKFNKSIEDLYNTDQEYKKAVNEVLDSGEEVNYSNLVKQAINESDVGVLIDRHILINREEIIPKLAGLSEMGQVMEIGRIANQINLAQTKKEAPVKVSQAPDPIETSTGSASYVDEDAERRKRDKTFSIE